MSLSVVPLHSTQANMSQQIKPNPLCQSSQILFGEKDFIGGNPWGGISADPKKGVVFLTTGNPKPNYVGTSRPGKNLFANSIIAFDIRNQKKIMAFSRNMS